MLLDESNNKLMEIQKNSDGTFDFEFDSDNLDEIADKLGITEEALLSCVEAMQIWGDIDLYDMDDVMAGLEGEGLVTKVRRKAQTELYKELKELGKGGGVDLTIRPKIDTQDLVDAGYENAGDGIATVFTHTFSTEDESRAINFTPILTDENGNYLGVMKPTEFANYCQGVVDGIHEDTLNLQIGGIFTGEDAIEQAVA